mmetsp:Transcript_10239/g.26820  ORF Transcript_10239/g.26820 Transcript_10239/m.26820 type:complete len:211 (+) Transcript_10239:800-1432(+)
MRIHRHATVLFPPFFSILNTYSSTHTSVASRRAAEGLLERVKHGRPFLFISTHILPLYHRHAEGVRRRVYLPCLIDEEVDILHWRVLHQPSQCARLVICKQLGANEDKHGHSYALDHRVKISVLLLPFPPLFSFSTSTSSSLSISTSTSMLLLLHLSTSDIVGILQRCVGKKHIPNYHHIVNVKLPAKEEPNPAQSVKLRLHLHLFQVYI